MEHNFLNLKEIIVQNKKKNKAFLKELVGEKISKKSKLNQNEKKKKNLSKIETKSSKNKLFADKSFLKEPVYSHYEEDVLTIDDFYKKNKKSSQCECEIKKHNNKVMKNHRRSFKLRKSIRITNSTHFLSKPYKEKTNMKLQKCILT